MASSSSSSASSSSSSPSFSDMISCVEAWLPAQIRMAPSVEKIKLFDSISSMYKKRDAYKSMVHEQYRQTVQMYYKPKHPELFRFQAENLFVPSFLHMLKDGGNIESIRRSIYSHGPLLYSFDMFQPRICSLLIQEVDHYQHWLDQINLQRLPPNSICCNGVVLDDFGFTPFLENLVKSCITPLASILFPQFGKANLDSQHGYVVKFKENQDGAGAVGCHVDDSEVTLNVCLQKPIEGGKLYFRGVRCTQHILDPEREQEVIEYTHIPGRALLHLGHHRHGAKEVIKGERINLVVWCRSSKFRESAAPIFVCPPWCNATQKKK